MFTIREAINNDSISYEEFYNTLEDNGIGDWDNVNSTDIIREYILEQIKQGIKVSHILEAIENKESIYGNWKIWLGCSLETPEPINSKEELADALGLDEEDCKEVIEWDSK